MTQFYVHMKLNIQPQLSSLTKQTSGRKDVFFTCNTTYPNLTEMVLQEETTQYTSEIPSPLWVGNVRLFLMVEILRSYIRHENSSVQWILEVFGPAKTWCCGWRSNLWHCPKCFGHLTETIIAFEFSIAWAYGLGAIWISKPPTICLVKYIQRQS